MLAHIFQVDRLHVAIAEVDSTSATSRPLGLVRVVRLREDLHQQAGLAKGQPDEKTVKLRSPAPAGVIMIAPETAMVPPY